MDQYKIFRGKTFDSEQEIEHFTKNYQNQTKQVFNVKTSKKLSSIKSKKYQEKNTKLIYYNIELQCKYGKQRKTESNGLRRTRTFKRGCRAFIKIKISTNQLCYTVVQCNLQHTNHEGLEHLYQHLPEIRRLNDQEKEVALNNLDLGCKPARLQEKLRENYRKPVRAKDLLNLQASVTGKDDDNLQLAVKLLNNEYGANTEILEYENEFQGLYFSTPEMKENMKKFPEILFIDGTYKIFKARYTLMLIVIEDGNGRSKVVGVGILRNETKPVLKWFIQKFKVDNAEACRSIKGVLSDKDLTERPVVKEIFPHVQMFICQFHALRSFSRHLLVGKMEIKTIDQRLDLLRIINSMVKSENSQDFDSYLAEFYEKAPTDVKNYFDDNWLCIKTEWVKYCIFHANFGNLTNNRIESINHKLKAFLGKYNSLMIFIRDFFKWDLHRNLEMSYKDIQSVLKVDTNISKKSSDNVQNYYKNLLTEYAYNIVLTQLQYYAYITIRSVNNTSMECTVKQVTKTEDIIYVTPESCTCFDRISMMLPCRHIFAVRQKYELDLCDKSLCHDRWKKEVTSSSIIKSDTSDMCRGAPCIVKQLTIKGKKSIGERRRKAKIVTDELLQVITEMPEKQFDNRLDKFKKTISKWKKNKDSEMTTSESNNSDKEELTDIDNSIEDSRISLENIKLLSPKKIIGKVSGS